MQWENVSSRTSAERETETASMQEVSAVDLLESQHREVEALFEEICVAGDRALKRKEKLFEDIAAKLTLHTRLEETIFYPAAKRADEDMILEAYEEHANVKSMLRKIKNTSPDDETFDARITVLKEMVEHHVKEEENELFPKCKQALGDDLLKELGAEMRKKVERYESSH